MNNQFTQAGIIAVTLVVGFTATSLALDFAGLSFARHKLAPTNSITVSGIAKQDEINQTAQFNANVSETGDSKEAVNQSMQEKVKSLTQAAIDFGIPEDNIKTQYFNIYQEEITDYEANTPTVKKGPWRGNTNISFSKVTAQQAESFAQVLISSGATSIDGPSFSTGDIDSLQTDLAVKALENARSKAQTLAESQGKSVGQILGIDETGSGGGVMPFMRYGLGGGGGEAAFSPGSTEVSKTVIVTFELK